MQLDIVLKNYRCFPDSTPARISVRGGSTFTAFVGANNTGKSSLLKFFYEFRQLFVQLCAPDTVRGLLLGNPMGLSFPSSVPVSTDVFSNTNDRALQLQFHFNTTRDNSGQGTKIPVRLTITVQRHAVQCTGVLHLSEESVNADTKLKFAHSVLAYGRSPLADFGGFFQLCEALKKTLYIGAFRNAINVGSNASYYDIKIG